MQGLGLAPPMVQWAEGRDGAINIMPHAWLPLAAMLLTASTLAAQVQAPDAGGAEAEIARRIRARLDAHGRGDATAWAQYVADDCICGTETKADIQRAIATRPPGVKNWYGEIADLQFRLLGDAAVARYRLTENVDVGDSHTSLQVWRTETYALRDAKWMLIAGADTLIPPPPVATRIDPRLFDRYVGRYQYAPGVIDTITREGDRLFVQSTGEAREELFSENETTFFVKGQDWRLVFVKDSQGLVTSLVLRQNGQSYTAARLP